MISNKDDLTRDDARPRHTLRSFFSDRVTIQVAMN